MIVAHVQARMGSTRLPGKVLKDVCGKPVLWHIVYRLSFSKLIDKIVIVTSDQERDKVILAHANEWGVPAFAGSEKDLVDRHYRGAKKFGADTIVRITADCPFVDPVIVDNVIKKFQEGSYDYVSNIEEGQRTYPDGLDVEVFSFKALELVWRDAKTTIDREIFTMYIQKHSKKFRMCNVPYVKNISYMRWTLDTENDLEFTREVYKELYRKGEVFLMDDILEFIKKHPELENLNKGLKRDIEPREELQHR